MFETSKVEYRPTPDSFFSEFAPAWKLLSGRFFKYEHLQSYREPGDASFEAFERGDDVAAEALLTERVLAQEPLFREAQERGVQVIRVRRVVVPVSRYVQYEFAAFRATAPLGEQIRVFVPGTTPPEAIARCTEGDFLLFDSSVVLIHDYDPTGLIRGGWVSRSPEVIDAYEQAANYLLREATPFPAFDSGGAFL